MSIFSTSIFVFVVLLSSFCGISIAYAANWKQIAWRNRVPFFFGIALGPFLLGISLVLSLSLLPNANPWYHLLSSCLLLCLISLGFYFRKNKSVRPTQDAKRDIVLGTISFSVLVVAWLVTLAYNTLAIPLVANDALEYMMVAASIYEHPTISTYPLLDPSDSPHGFYAPWTHPPLYVALLYSAMTIQGGWESTTLPSMIAAWSLAALAGLTFSAAATRSLIAGALATTMLFSTPLLFSGATEAMLDALPALGLFSVTIVLVFHARSGFNRNILAGVTLGLALWSHSQAIVFLPLIAALIIASNGLASWRNSTKEILTTIGTSLLIGGAPYFNNYLVFGAVISDTPIVFAIPSLEWDEYFEVARNLDSPVSMIQYGLLKGWFKVSSFGIIFWSALLAIPLVVRVLRQIGLSRALKSGIDVAEETDELLLKLTIVVMVFLGGTGLSQLLGSDIIVKNDRYFLATIAPLAVLTAFGIERAFYVLNSSLVNVNQLATIKEAAALAFGLVVGFAWISFLYMGYSVHLRYYIDKWRDDSPSQTISEYYFGLLPSLSAVKWANENVPASNTILAARPSDFYYSTNRMISYLDPRMVGVYGASNRSEAHRRLLDMGVEYIHTPGYQLPVVYNSHIQSLLADPQLAELVFDRSGAQIYHLRDAATRPSVVKHSLIASENQQWEKTTLPKSALLIPFWSKTPDSWRGPTSSTTDKWLGFFSNGYTTTLRYASDNKFPLVPGKEYILRVELTGRALVTIELNLHPSSSENRIIFGEFPMRRVNEAFVFERRFIAPQRQQDFELSITHHGASNIELVAADLIEVN